MKVKIAHLFVFAILFQSLLTLNGVSAGKHAPSFNLFQITTDGNQQNGPLIWENTVVWTDWRGADALDIWMYNLKTKREVPLIVREKHQRVYGIWNNLIIYRDESTSPPTVRVYNIKTNKDIEIASGENVGNGAIFGPIALYVDGVVFHSGGVSTESLTRNVLMHLQVK